MKKKNKVFKNNEVYGDHWRTNTYKELYNFICTFLKSSRNWLMTKKNLREYFSNVNIAEWAEYSEVVQTSFKPRITWIGHSTFLIQVGGINILTDPIFGNLKCVYPRNLAPGIELRRLPKLDFMMLSHNHADHYETKSVLHLKRSQPHMMVPAGNEHWLLKKGFKSVNPKDWWQEQTFTIRNIEIKFSFLPAIHWAGGLFSVNRSLWGSWMIECAGYKIYFAGDSAYERHFKEISEKHPDIDIALMPIGPDIPRESQKDAHVNAKESVQAFLDVKAKHFIPTHWGTFKYGLDRFEDPINLLKTTWADLQDELQNKTLHVLKIGQHVSFDEKDLVATKQPSGYEVSQD